MNALFYIGKVIELLKFKSTVDFAVISMGNEIEREHSIANYLQCRDRFAPPIEIIANRLQI